MPVLGLVLTLQDDSKAGRGVVLDRLLRERDVTIGDFEQGKLPVVLEVDDRSDGEERVRAVARLEGVAHVDVVYAHFEDLLREVAEPDPRSSGGSPWS